MATGYLYKFISADEMGAELEQTIYTDPNLFNLWGLLWKDKSPRRYVETELGCAELYVEAMGNVGKDGSYISAHPVSLDQVRQAFYEVRKAKRKNGIEFDVLYPSKYGL